MDPERYQVPRLPQACQHSGAIYQLPAQVPASTAARVHMSGWRWWSCVRTMWLEAPFGVVFLPAGELLQ